MKKYILNPYLPEYEYIPDGEPHVFDGRVYIYGSHDRFNGETFCMNDYVCYSADCNNLKEWRYEGVIFRKTQDEHLAKGNHELWAPDVVRGKDGRFYLYYCADGSVNRIGVAVCDEPAGSYEFLGLVRDQEGRVIGERGTDDHRGSDPAAFLDEDGTCYVYAGSGVLNKEDLNGFSGCSFMMEMEEDMVTVRREVCGLLPILGAAEGTAFEGHEFFEASSIRKIKGKYYLVYSSCNIHDLCYAVSDYPDRGFTYGGVIISNVDIMEHEAEKVPKNTIGNNHGGIACINGNYYIFYHRQTNGTMYSRQGCAEEIEILDDGKIPQVRVTSCGLNGEPLPGMGIYPASCVCLLYGKEPHEIAFSQDMIRQKQAYLTQDGMDFDMERNEETPEHERPRMYITNIQDGTHMVFRYFYLQNLKEIQVMVRGNASGTIKLSFGEKDCPFGEIPVSPSENWTLFSENVQIDQKTAELHFVYEGEGRLEFLEFRLNKEEG